jgi:gentisate 1,2-dioxygenase
MMSDLKSEPIDFDGAEHQAKLTELYRDFGNAGLTPLWQVRGNLQPFSPESRAVPHRSRWPRSRTHPASPR